MIFESNRTKDIIRSTLIEYYGNTYEEYYEDLSEQMLEELNEGLSALTYEERIEFTLRDFFMDLEVLNDELNISLEEIPDKIMFRLKEM